MRYKPLVHRIVRIYVVYAVTFKSIHARAPYAEEVENTVVLCRFVDTVQRRVLG
jgi:hypothetical protein